MVREYKNIYSVLVIIRIVGSFFSSLFELEEVDELGGVLPRGEVYHVPGQGVVHVGVGPHSTVIRHIPEHHQPDQINKKNEMTFNVDKVEDDSGTF